MQCLEAQPSRSVPAFARRRPNRLDRVLILRRSDALGLSPFLDRHAQLVAGECPSRLARLVVARLRIGKRHGGSVRTLAYAALASRLVARHSINAFWITSFTALVHSAKKRAPLARITPPPPNGFSA